jgi:hypothetical protein
MCRINKLIARFPLHGAIERETSRLPPSRAVPSHPATAVAVLPWWKLWNIIETKHHPPLSTNGMSVIKWTLGYCLLKPTLPLDTPKTLGLWAGGEEVYCQKHWTKIVNMGSMEQADAMLMYLRVMTMDRKTKLLKHIYLRTPLALS